MNTKKKLIAIIVAGLLVIALIIYFIFIYDFNKTPDEGDGQQTPNQGNVVSREVPPPPISEASPEAQARSQVTQLAMSFSERYGSSSNQAEFSNLTDLEIFMTPAMQEGTRQFVASEQAEGEIPTDYQGITTKSVVATITAITVDSAEVTVKTKRLEEKSNGEKNNYNQDLKLTMKKSGDTWLVDSAAWQ